MRVMLLLLLAILGFAALASESKFTLTSSSFGSGKPIPKAFTCDGKNLSPQLAWRGAPGPTRSFALVCWDPDAPGGEWVHWVLFNIPPAASGIPENGSVEGAVSGQNGWQKQGYAGPCPPPGKPHRYFFTLYALDAALEAPVGVTKLNLERSIQGHILGKAELMGTYGR